MKKVRLLIALLSSFIIAGAQTIKGKAVDLVDNKPLAGATLVLVSVKDSANRYNTVADSAGYFQFRNIPADSFFLKLSFVDYEEYTQIVSASDSTPVTDLGTLFIPKKTTELGDVTVVAKTPPVQQKGDTTQFNASQYKVNPDATTEDLIKKMPGITVDKNGTVTAQGDQVKKVTVDGKEFFGDDATAALRNLPAEIVDKIQVFDRMSDQAQFTGFDDGNSVKAINIVTKSGIKNGQFGRIYAGYGTDERYSAGGNVSFFKGDRRLSLVGNFNNINQQNFASQDLLGVTSSGGGGRGGGNFGGGRGGGGFSSNDNFSVGQQSGISKTNAAGINFGDKWGKKVNVTASYFFNNSNNSNDQLSKSQTTYPDGIQYINQKSISGSENYNHRFNLRLEYMMDSSNSLIINPSLNFQNNRSVTSSVSQSLFNDDTTSTSNLDSRSNRNGYNLRNNIFYRHSFAKRGRTFSINLNTTFNKNDGESYSIGNYRFFDESGNFNYDSLRNQFRENPTNGYTLSSNIAYTEPIGTKSQLQINYSPSYSMNKADQQTFDFDQAGGKYSVFHPELSNQFDNNTTTHNGGITYRLGNSRDNQFSVGLSLQYSRLESQRTFPSVSQVDQSFTTLLPNLMWRKKVSARSSFNIFYRANTNFPSITQLQDVLNVSSTSLSVSIGNPALKQSYTHFLSGRYTFTNTLKGQSFFANIFVQTAQDYITSGTYRISADTVIQNTNVKVGSTLTKPINLDGYQSFRSFFTYSQPVKFIKSNLSLSTGFTYSRLPGLSEGVEIITNNYVYSGGINIASNISEYVDFNLSYNINVNDANSSQKNVQSSQLTNHSAGIQLNLLSKNGWFLQNDISSQSYVGLSTGNQSYWLWNAAIGKKFLKNKAGELKLSVFDLLKQNQSITRTVEANYIEDSQSKVLQQYFMLTFTYSLKNFGTPPKQSGPQRRQGPRPGMNF